LDEPETTRVRLRFAKRGDLRLVSHHDLMRCLERALRRAALPMALSQGFNPRPKMGFPMALALGIEGQSEVLELELAEPMAPQAVLERLKAVAPPGLEFDQAEPISGKKAGQVEAVGYRIAVPEDRRRQAAEALSSFLARSNVPFTRRRPGRSVEIDLRRFLLDAQLDAEGTLIFRLKVEPTGSARPEEILAALGLSDLLSRGTVLVRTEVAMASS